MERIGVERSRAALERAELALVLVDGSGPLTAEDNAILKLAQSVPQTIVLATKADRPAFTLPDLPGVLALSSLTGEGLDALEREIARRFPEGGGDSGELLTSRRQAEAVQRASECLRAVFEGMERGMTPDATLSDVELALDALGEVTGRVVKDDVTNRIFERFCVGK